MSLTNYPPLIEGKIPAFAVTSDATQPTVVINVPYVLNKAVSLSDYNSMAIIIKTVTTGTTKASITTTNAQLQDQDTFQRYASFEFVKGVFPLTSGNYYKIQIAFQQGTARSPWSSVGVVKCTTEPNLSIINLKSDSDNANPTLYVGEYTNLDVTEKVYSYCFTIYDENNHIYETSGNLIHNGSTDENISGVGVKSTMQWQPQKALSKTKRYRATLKIETINGYRKETASYVVKAESTIDANIPALLLADPDYDNGRVKLSLVKPENLEQETAFTGNFVITRYTKSKNSWNEVCRFNMLSQQPSEVGILWTDYTLDHGEQYLYALQAYNSKNLYSNRQYHVLKSSVAGKYLHYDEFGEPYYITGDFEDMFLTDGERQLKIKFDPKVSTFKPTILENKIETIGSKYPFIFRNGNVNYKEFAISGLISHLMDDDELFMQGIKPPENFATRTTTPAAAGSEQSRRDYLNTSMAGSTLTSENFFRERQFKTNVLEWLTNGQPKLLRSPGEGSYIVQLINTSLSPNDTLGRMLHSFNSTAYEVAECNFNNLSKFNLLSPTVVENRTMKFMEVNLHSVSTAGTYSPSYGMYHVYITDVTPGTIYNLIFADAPTKSVSYRIGITGSLYLDMDTYPVTSITLVSGDYNHTAKLHYGYYDASVPDHFSYINEIISSDEIAQIIGYDETKNIITDKLEDIRREISSFYNVTIRPRNITTVYKSGSNYYRDSSHLTAITSGWSDLEIYYEGHSKIYYSGYPGNNKSLGSTLPKQYFKFNDLYILDLSTGNAYLSSDNLSLNVLQPNPSAAERFMSITNGSYQVVGEIGEIKSIYLSPGVYVDLAYDLKEIEYSVESLNAEEQKKYGDWVKAQEAYDKQAEDEKNPDPMNAAWTAYKSILTEDVKKAKADWQKAKVDYKYTPNQNNLTAITTKYNVYLTELQEAINLSYSEDGYYVL